MKFKILILSLFLVYIQCRVSAPNQPTPRFSLTDAKFIIHPLIILRDGEYYLKYQFNLKDTSTVQLSSRISYLVIEEKAYYYFAGYRSYAEMNYPIERPLRQDGLEKYAERGNVFWLNRDSSIVKLKIIVE